MHRLLGVLLLAGVQHVAGSEYVRGCYFTNWSQYRPGVGKYPVDAYIPGLCTHVMYAFAVINGADFTIKPYEWNDESTDWSKGQYEMVNDLKRTDPQLKTLLSVGGWNFCTQEATKGIFGAMIATAENRKRFIDSALALAERYKFDGIDIDWEYPPAEDKANYVMLLKELRTARPRMLLTAAVAAGDFRIAAGYAIPEIAKYVDYVWVMTYDFHGGFENFTGHLSPLYRRTGEKPEFFNWNTDSAAKIWADGGMPKKKIIPGVPSYGRGWTLADPSDSGYRAPGTMAPPTEFVREPGVASSYEICRMLNEGAVRHWDPVQQAANIVHKGMWYGYDDIESVTGKMKWLKQNGYGGAFVFSLDEDDFNGQFCSKGRFPLITTIKNELNGGGGDPTEEPRTTFEPTERPVVTTEREPTEHPVETTERPPATTERSGTTESIVCREDGMFPMPGDCTRYYECVGGRRFDFTCPDGTHFNPKLHICDYPQSAGCE